MFFPFRISHGIHSKLAAKRQSPRLCRSSHGPSSSARGSRPSEGRTKEEGKKRREGNEKRKGNQKTKKRKTTRKKNKDEEKTRRKAVLKKCQNSFAFRQEKKKCQLRHGEDVEDVVV